MCYARNRLLISRLRRHVASHYSLDSASLMDKPSLRMNAQDRLAARSLAYHLVIADRIEREPGLIAHARRNLERWRDCNGEGRWMCEWLDILEQPLESVVRLLRDPGQNATRLRSSSPFSGILTEEERLAIAAKVDFFLDAN
jgi:hypothetical protein